MCRRDFRTSAPENLSNIYRRALGNGRASCKVLRIHYAKSTERERWIKLGRPDIAQAVMAMTLPR